MQNRQRRTTNLKLEDIIMINCRIYLHGSEIHELLNLIKFTTHDDHRDEGRLLLRRGDGLRLWYAALREAVDRCINYHN